MGFSVLDCSLCREPPEMEISKSSPCGLSKDGRLFRLACNNLECKGHHGRWYFSPGQAMRAWNGSQSAKRHAIRSFQTTGLIKELYKTEATAND